MKYEQGSSDVVDLLVINYIIVCHFIHYCVEFHTHMYLYIGLYVV